MTNDSFATGTSLPGRGKLYCTVLTLPSFTASKIFCPKGEPSFSFTNRMSVPSRLLTTDRIETLLSRFYRTRDESPEWELTWDHVCGLFEQKNKPPAARCNALVPIFVYILQTERVG